MQKLLWKLTTKAFKNTPNKLCEAGKWEGGRRREDAAKNLRTPEYQWVRIQLIGVPILFGSWPGAENSWSFYRSRCDFLLRTGTYQVCLPYMRVYFDDLWCIYKLVYVYDGVAAKAEHIMTKSDDCLFFAKVIYTINAQKTVWINCASLQVTKRRKKKCVHGARSSKTRFTVYLQLFSSKQKLEYCAKRHG